MIFEFIDGRAADQTACRPDVEAVDRVRLRPRVPADIENRGRRKVNRNGPWRSRERWDHALLVEGSLYAEDAVAARGAGVDRVCVCSHGPAQLGGPGTAAIDFRFVIDEAGEAR